MRFILIWSKPYPFILRYFVGPNLVFGPGVIVLSELYHHGNEAEKREYVYYLAVGNAKLGNFIAALKFCDAILTFEPKNHQALALRRYVRSRIVRDGLIGMAVLFVGAVILGFCTRRMWRRWT